jgi:hypothetical protein
MLSVREISTCGIRLFLSNLQRFFKPSPSSKSTEKSRDLPAQTDELWAHSREDSGNHERADGAHCASLRFSSVSQHLLRSDERQAQPESVMAPAGPPES